MRLLLLLTLLTSLGTVAQSPDATITLTVKGAPLENVIKTIGQQSGYTFVYTREQLKNTIPVTLQLKGARLEQALAACFKNQPLTYIIEGRYIALKERPLPEPPQAPPVKTIYGRVTGPEGEPLGGATVAIRGKAISTATEGDGRFTLANVEETDYLFVSNVGYHEQLISLKHQTFLDIHLQRAITALDETVVIAYGTTTRRLNTGSVSKVTGSTISRQPVSNPVAALQGRVPGLFITQQNGLPGSNFSVLIRGRNSIQSGTSPLFIIDGVPFLNDADRLTQRGGTLNANNPFNSINPLDIESIEILKDADATAIYGSRGANGVILITTKKGRSGKTSVVANYSTGWSKVTRTMQYMNTPQYLAMRREAFQNDGVTPTLSNAYDLLAWDTTRYTNWRDLLIGGTARQHNASVRLSGGTPQTAFALSSQYYRESTVFPADDRGLLRANIALDLRHQATDGKFGGTVTSTYAHQKSTLPQVDLTQFITLAPNAPPLYDSLGRLNWNEKSGRFINPLAQLEQAHIGITDRLTANANLFFTPLKSLTLRTSLGYNSLFFDETALIPIAAQDPARSPKGSATFGNNRVTTWIIEPQAEYNTTFSEKGEVQVLAGGTLQETINKALLVEGRDYNDDHLLGSTAGAGTLVTTNSYSQYRYLAGFGRINLRWDRRLLLNLTARRDGSSRFGPDQRYANFGAIGGGWIFSKERFLSKALPFISYGKLRASYGVTGNDQIGDYRYLDSYGAPTFGYQGLPSLQPMQLFNADYSWERNKKWEAALELGFFKDRLLTTVNWFLSKSDNQLIVYTLPTQTGFAGITQNFPGVVQNRGVEVELSGTLMRQNDFTWKSDFNITFARNKLLSFPDLENSSYVSNYAVGHPLNVVFGYQFTGVDPATGLYTFEDRNHDGVISAQSGKNFNDYGVLGTTNPDFYGGWQHELTYKNIGFQVLLQFVKQLGRHPIYSSSAPYGALNANQPVDLLEHWTRPGDVALYQKYNQRSTGNPAATALRQVANSSAVLTDASYVRLKNLQLQYTFPASLLRKARLSEARFYVQAQNLATLTSFEGADPEGGGRQNLPPLRTIATGIELKF